MSAMRYRPREMVGERELARTMARIDADCLAMERRLARLHADAEETRTLAREAHIFGPH